MISVTPQSLNELSAAEKRALLAQLLQQKANKPEGMFPLSHGQQALWFLYQIAPESPAYNVPFVAYIRSEVDADAMRRTFQGMLDRHPSLRATFALHDGQLVQQIHDSQKLDFDWLDVSNLSRQEMEQRVIEAHERPFNLERGPVMRVRLFTRSAREHVFLLSVHHIACDFYSLVVLMDELRLRYPKE